MKWLLAIGLVVVSISTGTFPYGEHASASDTMTIRGVDTPTIAHTTTPQPPITETLFGENVVKATTILGTLNRNTTNVLSVVSKLKSRVGKTWYVFSGHEPQGWDCSGLVYWAYTEQLGIPVEHSANKQGHSGTIVKEPKIGDIVVFGYKGSKSYYHAAIYIGHNKVIHAGFRKGTRTAVISLKDPAFKDSTITFVRLINTNL